MIRLFLRTFVDLRRDGRYGGYPWSRSHSENAQNNHGNSNGAQDSNHHEMKRRGKFQQRFNKGHGAVDPDKTFGSLFDDSVMLTTVDDDKTCVSEGNSRSADAAGPSNTINAIACMPSTSSPKNFSRTSRLSTNVSVTVKTDIVVEVDEEMGSPCASRSSPIPMPTDAHSYPTFTPQDDRNRVEMHASAYAWKDYE